MPVARRVAKLSVPRAGGALVRPRLHRLLDDAIARGAVLVVAGPGSGKSTLAVTWGTARAGRLLWFRADEGDADPAEAFDSFRQLAGSRQATRALPSYSPRDVDRLDMFARTFFRAFFRIVPAASTLVVDDVHTAADDTFATLLAAAIHEAPHDVAVIALSRQEPAGPLLDHVASGRMQIIDGVHLVFDASEAITLLADRVDAKMAGQLHARTHGWAAGMLLLAQAPNGAAFDLGDVGERRIAAYFDERVLRGFAESDLHTLATASLLPEIDGKALARLGLDSTATDLLERLRRENVFVVRLDRTPTTWRFHDLLRGALRARFRSLGTSSWRRDALTAAATIAANVGHVRDAVQMYIEAGAIERARELAEGHARALVRAHRLAELESVVAALPAVDVDGNMVLQLALGECAWQRNDAHAALARFERAYSLLDASAPSKMGLLLASSALNAVFEGWQSYEGARVWADRLLQHLQAREQISDPHDILRIDRAWLLTANQLWDDSICERPALFDRMLAFVRNPPAAVAVDEIIATSSVLIEASGFSLHDETRFQATVAASAPWLAHSDLSPLVKAMWLNAYAGLGRHWPSPGVKLPASGGRESIELAYTLARDHGGQALAFVAADFLCHDAVSDNDLSRARHWLRCQRECSDARHAIQTVTLSGTEAAVLALAGEWNEAESAFDRADALARANAHPEEDFWSRALFRRRVQIARGDTERAREGLLQEAETYPEGMRRDFALILADVALAAGEWNEHGRISADAVTRVMARASAYNWRGITILLAPTVARICSEALRQGIEADFARRLIREKRLPAPSPHEPTWPWRVRIHALGGLRIFVDERSIAFGARAQRKPLDLVKVIVAHGPAPVDAAVVLDALWPDAEGAAARAAFDMAVMRLRKLLGRDDALVLDAGHIGFDPGSVWVDAYAYASGATQEYPGPLFGTDAVEPWWALARERLHQRFLRRAVERGRDLESEGALEDAISVYESGIAQDPLAEDLYQGAIRCHLARNRPADALRVFRRCRQQLSIVLSVAPSPATVALVASLVGG